MANVALPRLVALFLPLALLSAHGGQYRGPNPYSQPPLVPVRIPGGVAPPAPPPSAPTPAPTTGARDVEPAASTWQTWWEFNKEPFLLPQPKGQAAVTGSDDFYLGQRRPGGTVEVLEPNDQDRRDRIAPALLALLEGDRNRDIQSACLIALAKVGEDPGGAQGLTAVLAGRIARDDQEVRETAVLALGIAARADAFEALAGLVADGPEGRKLAGRDRVRDRTRAFAAYGLGLLARRSGDPKLAQRAFDVLWATLEDRQVEDIELRTALVNGLGVLRADPGRAADKRLGWQAAEALLAWFVRDAGPTEQRVQAQAPVAIARLLGRGDSLLHRRAKQCFTAELDQRKPRSRAIQQSCALALGGLVLPSPAAEEDEAAASMLRLYWERGHDESARQFCAIALGRIGGDANREWLRLGYERGKKSIERPWLALSLGLLASRAAEAGSVDVTVAERLLEDLRRSQTDDERSALAIAVGLTRYRGATGTLLDLLNTHERDERNAAYLCVGLGLLGDDDATAELSAVLERSGRRPFLLQQCAVALGCLGDVHANDRLLAMLRASDSVAVLAALATAIGRIGDRRAIDPLIAASRDQELTRLARAFVGAALGWIGDRDAMPWNVPLSVDANYTTGADTLTNGAAGVLDIL